MSQLSLSYEHFIRSLNILLNMGCVRFHVAIIIYPVHPLMNVSVHKSLCTCNVFPIAFSLLTLSDPAILVSYLFLKNSRDIPASGNLHQLFPLLPP